MSTADDAPLPPRDLAHRRLPIVETAGPWLRLHRAHHGPVFFGRTLENRFDDPRQELGVLYAAETLDGAFIETFGRNPGLNTVSARQLSQRSLARLDVTRPLRLVDLTGPGLARLGTTAAMLAGRHRRAQVWSRALWSHPDRPDGILYRARYDPSCICVAIFDRAEHLLRAQSLGDLVTPANLILLSATLRRYDFSLRP
ncbi:MAG TPA: RES family NAD+ phosphorylase [Chloroflexota bacterium]|nr:RES family NAD+ phosphorylase [Chloroflexota bacterium]